MATHFIVKGDNKSHTIYTEDNGKYYRQHMLWWEKGGYCVPQTRKKIRKAEYDMMLDFVRKEGKE